MEPYVRPVQYYETDMMGVAHHANYLHWMEEARIDFMDRIGFPYTRMEAGGVVSPVVEIACRYRKSCTFGDVISIRRSCLHGPVGAHVPGPGGAHRAHQARYAGILRGDRKAHGGKTVSEQ